MEPKILGGYRSTSELGAFFLSKQNRDPEVELRATLDAFANDPRGSDENAQCLFPARKKFLSQTLDLKFKVIPKCTAFTNFRKQIDAHAVSVVFSSYFLNNPSSAFGHTFLRLSRLAHAQNNLPPSERFELLDTGISYAANPTTQNPLFYAYDGAFGRFTGSWTAMPYFYKVHEYNDADSRDLWSYDLRFDQAQIDLLVAHLWELGHANFPYYYFTRNCSYHVLAALEVADPDIDLLGHVRAQAIPVDTIKALYKNPGFVTGVSFRPSIRTQLLDRYGKSKDQDLALELTRTHNFNLLTKDLNDERKAAILDLAIDKVEFDSRRDLPGKGDPFKQRLFLERSRLAVVTPKQQITPDSSEAPQRAHGTRLLGAFTGANSDTQNFSELQYRFALHSFIDPSAGYPDFAEIEMLSLTGRYDWSSHQVELERAQLFHVTSLAGWTPLFKPVSWELSLGSTTVRDERCDNCFATALEGGSGITLAQSKRLITALLVKIQALGSDSFSGFFQFATGPELKLVFRPSERTQIVLRSQYNYHLHQEFSYDWVNSLEAQVNLTSALALRLSGNTLTNKIYGDEVESKVGMLYYF